MTARTSSAAMVFALPDLGEGLTEAEILSWRVAEGDEVGVDDIVVEVETAKAAVEVPSPYAGTVTTLHGKPGQVIEVGQALLTIAPPADPVARTHEAHRTEERAGSGAVLVGYGTDHSGRGTRRRRTRRRNDAAPAAPRVISPVVRRLARDAGLDLSSLAGSGPAGVILRRDVEIARDRSGVISPESGSDAEPAQPARVEPPPASPLRATTAARDRRIPLTGVRRMVADKLTRSRREIPDATTWVDVDATGLIEAREALRATHPQVSLLALLARFTVAGLVRFGELNSSVDGDHIVQHGQINLGFAAQTDRGLVVPVVKGAGRMTTVQLSDEIARLTAAARDGTLEPADLTSGTFTLNNYGVFGVDGSTPIINHPEAALLGVGRIVDKPWAVDGALAVRKVTQLSLTFDHRVCDGGTAGGFLRYVADCVERPVGLLADL
jgi:2-oxoisovalerate dehydrogenase E2 component (dihydrolipoyl transacylase)